MKNIKITHRHNNLPRVVLCEDGNYYREGYTHDIGRVYPSRKFEVKIWQKHKCIQIKSPNRKFPAWYRIDILKKNSYEVENEYLTIK